MDLYEIADQLDAATRAGEFDGYGPRPIPHPLDERVEAFVRAARRDGPNAAGVVACLDTRVAFVLLAYAERAAALAVRHHSTETLELSVLALGLARPRDPRDKLVVMPLPWRSAGLLGADPRLTYERVAGELPEPGRGELLAFVRRRPADQTLSAMGYCEGTDQDGFRYQPLP